MPFPKTKMKLLALLTSSLVAFTLSAQVVPTDPTLRTGVLDNGLTYYIKQNNFPQNRADFFIAQRVGSIQEEENQRGLAHFLEHMCFNGTKHFPGNSLIDYMEQNGVKFGANLNAYTSTDETVYNISNVPTGSRNLLDSCLIVLSDWSHDLTLDPKEIDKERGVIQGEYRMRSGANYRLMEKAAADLYPNCLYGKRMPIGLMSVVTGFKHKELKDYYKKWYHPGNQCVIVVGDIDPDWVEARIRQLFGKIKRPKNAAQVVPVTVPANATLISTVQHDPEQTSTSVRVLYKHDDIAPELVPTTEALRYDYLKHAVSSMLTARLREAAQRADAPFTFASAKDGNYLISKTQPALNLIATAKDGMADSSMRALAREVQRATQYGFTDSELKRVAMNYHAALDRLSRERDRQANTALARQLVRTYLDGEPFADVDTYCTLMGNEVDRVTVDDVNAYLRSVAHQDERNTALIVFAPDQQEQNLTADALAAAYHDGWRDQVTPYADSLAGAELFTKTLPAAGSITNETPVPLYDAKLLTLSNGIRVYLKHTDINPGEVIIAGSSQGGFSQNYRGAEDAPSMKSINAVVAASAVAGFTNTDLKKVLAGKEVKMKMFVSKTEEGFQGSAANKDLETAFQLLYLRLTDLQKDNDAFNAYIANNRARIARQGADPKFEFADSIFANVYDHHPLGAERLTLEELNKVDYDRIMEVYHDRFADMSDFALYIVGDFNEDTLRTLLCRYVATLPAQTATPRNEQPRDIGFHIYSHDAQRRWTRAMENPQDKVYFFWTSPCEYNLRNRLLAKITGQIFTNIFREQLREERGWTYHVDTHCSVVNSLNGNDAPVIFMPLNVTVTAGKADETRDIILSDINDVAQRGITADQLDKVKKYLRKVHSEDLQDNTYWMSMMKTYESDHLDFHTDYLNTLDAITPADIQAFVQRYIAAAARLSLTMQPAN